MKKAVYAGSFDPITNGHLWMVARGTEIFDELVVAMGENPDKHYSFTREERLDVLHACTKGMKGVRIDCFEGRFLVNYAQSIGAQYILRGIRNAQDYEFERGMRHINDDLQPDVTTVFLMPPRPMAEVSSSLVKGLIGPEGWRSEVSRYVPDPVYQLLLTKFENG